MANNTGNPIGSTAAKDLSDNAQNLDKFANGDDYEYADRLGRSRKSLKWIEDAALAIPAIDAAVRSEQQAERSKGEANRASIARVDAEAARDTFNLNIGRKADIAEGLRDTVSGQSFTVISPNSREYIIEYENVGGAAQEVKRYSSAAAVDDIASRLPRLEWGASRRLPRGRTGTRFAVSVGNQMLAYLDRDGIFHSSHEHAQYLDQSSLAARQKPKKRPRSRNYPHPMVIVSGGSVVLATSDITPDERITALEADRDTTSAGLVAITARLDLVESSQGASVEFAPPQWLVREITAEGEQQVMVHDGQSYRQLTPAGANWLAPIVGAGNVVRCLRESGGVVESYSILPNGFRINEGKVLLQKIITGQSLSVGSRGYVLNLTGEYAFEPGVIGGIDGVPGIGDLFTTSIPEEMRGYCLSLQGGPRPNMVATPAFIPIREYPNGVLGETISSSWALALRRWAVRSTRADVRLLATVHGIGGVPYVNLKKGTSIYAAAITSTQNANALAVANGWQHVVSSISIIHGESQTATTAAIYAGYLAEWLADYTTDVMAITGQTVPPKGFLSQMSTHYSATQEIPLGQLLAHETNPAMCLIGPKYQFPYWDSAHILAEGYIKLGELEARAERFALLGEKWQPLRPMSVKLVGTTLTVQLSNDPSGTSESAGPVGALVFDTAAVADPGHYGFALSDPAAVIQSVTLGSDRRSVVIQLAAPPAAAAKLEYAMQLNLGDKPGGGPRGCLRDTDTRDRSRFDGGYLYNWCVAFRKTIEVEI